MMKFRCLILIVSVSLACQMHGQQRVSSLDELYRLADSSAFALRIQNKELMLAKLTKQAAYGNVINPRIPVNASLIDNTELPVNFIPAEVFGGPPGTFREVVFGQQYISSLTVTPQLDLIAPGRWGEVRMAEVNYEKVQLQGEISRRDVRNSLSSFYYTLLHLKTQQLLLDNNIAIADSIFQSVKQKAEQGLARQSDVNEAEVFLIQQKNFLGNSTAQYDKLMLQLESMIGCKVELAEEVSTLPVITNSTSNRELDLRRVEMLYAKSAWRGAKLDQLPTLAFVSSFAYQNNSNERFFDSNQRWINSNYIGLRLTWDFPTNIPKLTQSRNQKLNYNIASLRYEQALISLKNRDIEQRLEWERLEKEWKNLGNIKSLEIENLKYAQEQYNQGIIPLERLLQVQLNKIQSELNEDAAKASCAMQAAIINNGL